MPVIHHDTRRDYPVDEVSNYNITSLYMEVLTRELAIRRRVRLPRDFTMGVHISLFVHCRSPRPLNTPRASTAPLLLSPTTTVTSICLIIPKACYSEPLEINFEN